MNWIIIKKKDQFLIRPIVIIWADKRKKSQIGQRQNVDLHDGTYEMHFLFFSSIQLLGLPPIPIAPTIVAGDTWGTF